MNETISEAKIACRKRPSVTKKKISRDASAYSSTTSASNAASHNEFFHHQHTIFWLENVYRLLTYTLKLNLLLLKLERATVSLDTRTADSELSQPIWGSPRLFAMHFLRFLKGRRGPSIWLLLSRTFQPSILLLKGDKTTSYVGQLALQQCILPAKSLFRYSIRNDFTEAKNAALHSWLKSKNLKCRSIHYYGSRNSLPLLDAINSSENNEPNAIKPKNW